MINGAYTEENLQEDVDYLVGFGMDEADARGLITGILHRALK